MRKSGTFTILANGLGPPPRTPVPASAPIRGNFMNPAGSMTLTPAGVLQRSPRPRHDDGPHDALAPHGPSSTSTTSHHSRCMTRQLWQYPTGGRALASPPPPERTIRGSDARSVRPEDPQPPVATDFPRPPTTQPALSTHEFIPRVKRKFSFKKHPHHALLPRHRSGGPPAPSTHFMQGARTCSGSSDFYVLA